MNITQIKLGETRHSTDGMNSTISSTHQLTAKIERKSRQDFKPPRIPIRLSQERTNKGGDKDKQL